MPHLLHSSIMRAEVEELLRRRDYDLLVDLCLRDCRVWQQVRYRLYDLDEAVRWAAVETVAKVMERRWRSGEHEKVRNYVRTLFWSMSDESGGIGWSAPQTIGEIIAHIPEIIDPYGSMMIAYSIEEPPFIKGGLWGIGRLGERIAESVDFFRDKIFELFESVDVETLGLLAWVMGEAVYAPALPFLEKLTGRTEMVQIYSAGAFSRKSLGEWAAEAVRKITASTWKG
ncbi:MAG: DVU0298 family protein [Nitrospirota bacterium]